MWEWQHRAGPVVGFRSQKLVGLEAYDEAQIWDDFEYYYLAIHMVVGRVRVWSPIWACSSHTHTQSVYNTKWSHALTGQVLGINIFNFRIPLSTT